jgi:hypothetical protein
MLCSTKPVRSILEFKNSTTTKEEQEIEKEIKELGIFSKTFTMELEESKDWTISNEHFYLNLKDIQHNIGTCLNFFRNIKGMNPQTDKGKETQRILLEAYDNILKGYKLLQQVNTLSFKERYSKGLTLKSLMKIPE